VYRLYVANKNYSSWSLRPWVLLRELNIPFDERLLRFGDTAAWQDFRSISPAGKVPCLVDGAVTVWDSLAIVEYLAERHEGVWPMDPAARAWARSAAAEMHSGFGALRSVCAMSCGIRVQLSATPPSLASDIARLSALWADGLQRFRGTFLAGPRFTAVDAFFAPVAFRWQTYGFALDAKSSAYATRLLELESMQQWYRDALAETFRDAPHDAEISLVGKVTADWRSN
jgi:glutathione S-transferase